MATVSAMSTHVPLDDRISVGVTEGARLTGIGRSTLYELIGDGVIPAKKVGRRTLVLVADLEQFIGLYHCG
jgi:excisionase family DNA binding protein